MNGSQKSNLKEPNLVGTKGAKTNNRVGFKNLAGQAPSSEYYQTSQSTGQGDNRSIRKISENEQD